MLRSRKKHIEEDECDVSWYKEMAGRVWEMCHSKNGSVFNSSERTEVLDFSVQPLFVFLDSASWTGSYYRLFSPPAKLDKSSQVYNADFLASGMNDLPDRRKIFLLFLCWLYRV